MDSRATACALPAADLRAAAKRLAPAFRDAVETAVGQHPRVRATADAARMVERRCAPACALGQIVRPLDTVAAYIPAGRYPLPSTVMMTVIPAQVAGVANICVASPKPVD